ncbi:MAG: hybrid sensor histidine kinase/response regulator [Bacteroidia bacterium]|nr:hybrid sensor histidine kinase/response regulator [Bacteroidia bacterium]
MRTILIVDDEPVVVEALTAQLTPLEVWIEGAYSAEEALALLERDPAVIIADYLMPVMRGDDFLIEAHKKVPHARLILLTGQAGAENVGKIVNQARLFRYIPKPWEVADLRLTVQAALESYQTEIHLQERQKLTTLLLAYLQELLACEKSSDLPTIGERWSERLFGKPFVPSTTPPPQILSPAQHEAWTLFSQTFSLRAAHLHLLEELENQVQARTAHLASAVQELKALTSQREAWIKIISHDLRGPLSGLRQLATLLRKSSSSDDQISKYTSILENSLSELENYVKNLLDLSRLSQKEIALHFTHFSWREIGEKLHALVAPQLELKRIQWESHTPDCTGWGDPVYATEALYNLVSNAIKFTPPGGKVQFTVQPQDKVDIVEIKDTGIGMETELIEALWEPTKRRSRVGTAGEKGTGLGLPIAQAILHQHSVSIEVHSAPGKGTTFRLHWPRP